MDISDLDSQKLDVLTEIGNIGAGNAATALSKLLGKKVEMNVPKAEVLGFREVAGLLGGAELPVACVLLSVDGDLKGIIMFILECSAARGLLDMLLTFRCEENGMLFTELEVSALKEIGNILASSYISALSTLTGLRAMPSVPDFAVDMAGAILSVPAIEFGKTGDSVLFIKTEFFEGSNRVAGNFLLVPFVESYNVLLKALGVITDE